LTREQVFNFKLK